MKAWILELCPEIAEWQAQIIAEEVDNMVASEREACYCITQTLNECLTEIQLPNHYDNVAFETVKRFNEEIQRLTLDNKKLREQREYVMITRDEWDVLVDQYSENEHNTSWRRFVESAVINRAGLVVKGV